MSPLCTAPPPNIRALCGKDLQSGEEEGSGTDGTGSDPLDTEVASSAGEDGRLGRSGGGDVAGGSGVGDRGRCGCGSRGLRLTVGLLGDGAGGDGRLGAASLRLPVGDLRDGDGRGRGLRLAVADGGDHRRGAGSHGAGHHGRRSHGRGHHHGRGHGGR